MSTDRPNLDRTRAALRAHDVLDEEWGRLLEAGDDDAALEKMTAAVDQAAAEVGKAFALDTADRNPSSVANLVRPGPWLRRLVAGPEGTIHVLHFGRPMCNFMPGAFPSEWPDGHQWVPIGEQDKATHKPCLDALAEMAKRRKR